MTTLIPASLYHEVLKAELAAQAANLLPEQLNVDNVKNTVASIRRMAIALAIIGCSLMSVGAVAAHADYYRHHHHYHHRQWAGYHHHRHYRYY